MIFNAKDKNQLDRIDSAIAEARLMTEKTRDDTLKAETINSERERMRKEAAEEKATVDQGTPKLNRRVD